jgi:hypothetical protein
MARRATSRKTALPKRPNRRVRSAAQELPPAPVRELPRVAVPTGWRQWLAGIGIGASLLIIAAVVFGTASRHVPVSKEPAGAATVGSSAHVPPAQ